MISSFSAIILGLVEGFTEFLPVSSTAHLILTSRLLGLGQTNFIKTFEIAIQSGAMLAVIAIYWRKLIDVEVLKRVIAAFIPTAIVGLIFYKIVKNYLFESQTVILIALALGGIVLIFFEKFIRQENSVTDIKQLSYGKVVWVGLAQAVSIIPGVSRSAATIVGGMFLGISKEAIVEFSFLLAIPTILAATVFDLIKSPNIFLADQLTGLGMGFIVSFLAAWISIKFLLSYVRNNSLAIFGWYRLILVAVFVLFLL